MMSHLSPWMLASCAASILPALFSKQLLGMRFLTLLFAHISTRSELPVQPRCDSSALLITHWCLCLKHLQTSSELELHPLPAHRHGLCTRPDGTQLPRVLAWRGQQPDQITFSGDIPSQTLIEVCLWEKHFPGGTITALC